jgi:hypothetical protein
MVMNSRRMRWAGHTAHLCDVTNAYRILVRKCEETTWETYADRMIILKWI